MGGSEQRAADEEVAKLAVSVVSYSLAVSWNDVAGTGRGNARIALARHVAMYLCHVGLEISLARVAVAFGRDRSTVAHACHAVEDRRDEPKFDRWVGGLEATMRRMPAQRRNIENAA